MRQPKTIVTLNGKGGVGKSNIVTNLAGMATMPGHGSRRIAVIDADTQCSIVDWGHNRENFMAKHPHRLVRKVEVLAPQPNPQLPGMIDFDDFSRIYAGCKAGPFDWCFIDTKGLADVQTNAIAVDADMIIVPCSPDEVEWAKLVNVSPIIDDADMRRGYQIPAFVILNKVHPSAGPDSVARLAAVVTQSGLETAPGWISRRNAVPDAYSAGLSVEELATDPAGTGEWCRFFDLVATILEASAERTATRKAS